MLIDLGEIDDAPPVDPPSDRPRRRREIGVAVAVVAALTLAGGARQTMGKLLGSVAGVSGDCQSGDGVVVCRRLDAAVGVWRYADGRRLLAGPR